MARIRTIKPEFPQSETIGRLSRDARLLFIQLWTVVDDDGRTRAASRMLASLLYPYDDDARELMDAWLDELEHEQCIRRYVVEGATYLEIVNWLKHQKIDRPSKSRLPSFDEGLAIPREPSRALDADLGPRTSTLDLGPEDQSLSEQSSDAASKKNLNGNSKKRNDYPSEFEAFWKEYPTDKLMSKKEAFDAWKRLSPDDRELAARAAPAFRRYCEQNPDYRTIHACRFITKRRFDNFATPGGANGPPAGLNNEERAKWVREQMEAENAAHAA